MGLLGKDMSIYTNKNILIMILKDGGIFSLFIYQLST